MSEITIPERIIEVPGWLANPQAADTQQIARDLTTLAFWQLVDNQVAYLTHKEWPAERAEADPKGYQAALKKKERKIVTQMKDDLYVRARFLAQGADKSFDGAGELGDLMEMVQVRIAQQMRDDNLLPYLEMDNVEQYLLSKQTDWDGSGPKSGNHSEIAFMLTYLIPVMSANGLHPDLILASAKNFQKTRYAIPNFRVVLRETTERIDEIRQAMSECDDPEELLQLHAALDEARKIDTRLYSMLEEWFKEIAVTKKDGGTSVDEFKAKMQALRKTGPPPVHGRMLGYKYILPGGTYMAISADHGPSARAIELLTANLVEWHVGDPRDLAREVGGMLNVDQKDN